MIEIGQLQIEPSLWRAILGLFFHYCQPGNPESLSSGRMVSVTLITFGRGMQRVLVPLQKVTSSTVFAESNKFCDLSTGEVYNSYPNNWQHAGEILSHNTMWPFFSGITDKSELGRPGTYLCVGEMDPKTKSYEVAASLVNKGIRHQMPADWFVDLKATPGEFHPKVLEYIRES